MQIGIVDHYMFGADNHRCFCLHYVGNIVYYVISYVFEIDYERKHAFRSEDRYNQQSIQEKT